MHFISLTLGMTNLGQMTILIITPHPHPVTQTTGMS